ncbi:M48 family metallopeptidase [Candidatus Roizmanbacteria bacterium]|nr:M48 family metallopeptidase [Candidatus Roizmanbacteria bacterium]
MGVFIVIFSGFFYLVGKYYQSPLPYFVLGMIVAVVSSLGSYFYSDKIVLKINAAIPADKKKYFNFYTVAQNLAIAAGLPMPKLYVIVDPAPNAFATGRDPQHAVVCATTGLLEMMNRTELEGVIAHELSHIKNYDILLTTVVAVLVGTVALITHWIWWGGLGRSRNDDERRSPIFFILFIVALILTPIVATIIQLAISRKREYLADASGVLLTRYPEGLARALEKIESDPDELATANSSTAHLFISNPFNNKVRSSWFTALFSTHPPIEERIKILRSM